MSQVLDYSWARPGARAIHDAGYVGVMRYLSYDTTGKNITAAEANDLWAHGLQVGLVWETTADRVKGGAAAGQSDAREALRQANVFVHTGAIYFAIDYDAPESDQGVINDYFRACAQVIGFNRIGCYAGYWPLKRLFDAGLISFGWQTLAWSGGNQESRAHLYQNGGQAFGHSADVDDVLKDNWGQTSAPGEMGTYVVQPGDTLSAIAQRFGTTDQNLAAINGIPDPNLIFPGQVLRVTGGSGAPSAGVHANGLTYTVVASDTLSAIGQRFGVDYHVIAQVNGIPDPSKIFVGQVLRIPGGGMASAPSSA